MKMKFFRLYLLFPVLLLFSVNVFPQQLTPEQTEKIFHSRKRIFPIPYPAHQYWYQKVEKYCLSQLSDLRILRTTHR